MYADLVRVQDGIVRVDAPCAFQCLLQPAYCPRKITAGVSEFRYDVVEGLMRRYYERGYGLSYMKRSLLVRGS